MLRRTLCTQLRAVVGVKNAIDYDIKVRVKDGAVVKDVKHSMNPFDEIAITAAVELKQKGVVTEIVAVTVAKDDKVLKRAYALGADKAILVKADAATADKLETLQVAKVFGKLHEKVKGDIYLMGKQAIDDDCGHVPQMISALLNIPVATFASEITVSDDKANVTVKREVDKGLQTIKVKIPAVISCDLRLNTPKLPKLAAIMAANKKPVETIELSSLGVDTAPKTETVKIYAPEERKGGGKVASVDELINKLKTEAKCI